jgi:hypothetical protein
MNLFGGLVITVFGLGPLAGGIYFGIKEDAARRRLIDPTRRAEKINGLEYSVYTLEHRVLREKSTGRLGIALERGYYPQWVRVQFFRKTDGEPGRVEWRSSSKFEIVGTAFVDYLSRRAGLLRTDHLTRYNVDLASLQSTILPRRRRSVASTRKRWTAERTSHRGGKQQKPAHANEQYRLGEAYSEGQGVPQSDAEAAKWWLKAAEQGHAAAQHCLALAYINGEGVQCDLIRAYMWLSIEQDAQPIPGHDRVFFNPAPDEIIETLEGQMTAKDAADARRLAQQWKPNPTL